ncbi:Na/Pi cotransporter family protein [Sneathiella chungangensis]|uniref:Na/Pi cotransporter family protein n=1 Tax=Sneathiella chungangensis TaxID=1418234 RepID=A0A845MFJ3_9PROT|nr:Na/Pi cotransporter family protein [Sneathiella chungangensis]MZR22421.1 Na/Pi cotransporter family protein [Sneathiella chungangensis]
MDGTIVLINLLGGVALLLWGLRMVSTGVMRAFGRELGLFLKFCLKNRVQSFFGGLTVTMLLQSSTATALLTATFAGRGLLPATAGIAIILGADVGTTLVAQILSFDLSFLAPVLLFVGFVRHATAGATRAKNLGRILLGLGMMLTALKMLALASEPIRDSSVSQFVLSSLSGEPVLVVLIAAIITLVAHSSLATVLFALSLSLTGHFPIDVAYAMVLGANLGGAAPPIMATLKAEKAARRAPLANLICRLVIVVAVLPFIGLIEPQLAAFEAEPARQIVNFHTLVNLACALVFLPFVGPLGRLTERLLPEDAEEDPNAPQPLYLDKAALESPQLAMANAVRETLRMGDVLEKMCRSLRQTFGGNDIQMFRQIRDGNDAIKDFDGAIKGYLTKLGRESLDEKDEMRCTEILNFTTAIDHISNIVVMNMLEVVETCHKNQVAIADEDIEDEVRLLDMVLVNLRMSFSVLMTENANTARNLIKRKQVFREAERKAVNEHLKRLRSDRMLDQEASAIHLSLLSDMRRINSLLSSNAYLVAGQIEQ